MSDCALPNGRWSGVDWHEPMRDYIHVNDGGEVSWIPGEVLREGSGEMRETNELLPCPFCGGEAEIESIEWIEPALNLHGAKCKHCGAESAVGETKALAIGAWNTRAERTCENAYEYRDSNGVLHRDARLFKCSECGFKVNDFYGDDEQSFPRYCPNCGARRVGE